MQNLAVTNILQNLSCHWASLREQRLLQWARLIPREVDAAGPHRYRLAALIQTKYGIQARLAENFCATLNAFYTSHENHF